MFPRENVKTSDKFRLVALRHVLAAVVALALAAPAAAQPHVVLTRADTLEAWRAAAPEAVDLFDWHTTEAHWYESPPGTVRQFASYAAFRDHPGPLTGTVMYDPERWPMTPRAERIWPRLYMRRFVNLGHARGQKVILAPTPALAIPDPKCRSFVYCGYLEIEADAFLLQAQNWLCVGGGDTRVDLDRFRYFVSRSARRVASPLIVEVSVWMADTVPCHQPAAVLAAASFAVGYADDLALWGRPVDLAGVDVLHGIAQFPSSRPRELR